MSFGGGASVWPRRRRTLRAQCVVRPRCGGGRKARGLGGGGPVGRHSAPAGGSPAGRSRCPPSCARATRSAHGARIRPFTRHRYGPVVLGPFAVSCRHQQRLVPERSHPPEGRPTPTKPRPRVPRPPVTASRSRSAFRLVGPPVAVTSNRGKRARRTPRRLAPVRGAVQACGVRSWPGAADSGGAEWTPPHEGARGTLARSRAVPGLPRAGTHRSGFRPQRSVLRPELPRRAEGRDPFAAWAGSLFPWAPLGHSGDRWLGHAALKTRVGARARPRVGARLPGELQTRPAPWVRLSTPSLSCPPPARGPWSGRWGDGRPRPGAGCERDRRPTRSVARWTGLQGAWRPAGLPSPPGVRFALPLSGARWGFRRGRSPGHSVWPPKTVPAPGRGDGKEEQAPERNPAAGGGVGRSRTCRLPRCGAPGCACWGPGPGPGGAASPAPWTGRFSVSRGAPVAPR